jgi:hypothetical protein
MLSQILQTWSRESIAEFNDLYKEYWRIPVVKWILIPTTLLALSSCGVIGSKPEPQVVVQTEYIERTIPTQPRPTPVEMPNVEWYVVNSDNLDEFLGRIEADAGDVVFIALTPKGYENLALGIADLRRFILEQREIIVYYEQQVAPPPAEESSS